MRSFGLVQLQGASDRVDDLFGHLAKHAEQYPDGTLAYPHLYQNVAVEGICEGE